MIKVKTKEQVGASLSNAWLEVTTDTHLTMRKMKTAKAISCSQCTTNSQLAHARDRGQFANASRYERNRIALEKDMNICLRQRYRDAVGAPKDS